MDQPIPKNCQFTPNPFSKKQLPADIWTTKPFYEKNIFCPQYFSRSQRLFANNQTCQPCSGRIDNK